MTPLKTCTQTVPVQAFCWSVGQGFPFIKFAYFPFLWKNEAYDTNTLSVFTYMCAPFQLFIFITFSMNNTPDESTESM
jgi:hypothetical protein